MLLGRLSVVAIVGATGCSFIYDADDLIRPDGMPIDAMPIDADPTMLAIDSFEPAELVEGTGAEGGRPAIVLFHGASIAGDVAVTATLDPPASADVEVGMLARSATTKRLAVEIRVPVLPDVGPKDEPRAVVFTITQAGAAPVEQRVPVVALPELTLEAGARAADDLAPLYSHIDVTGDVPFTGTVPVRLRATGAIVIGGVLDVDADGQSGGPHGCNGGGAQTAGGCGPGGGRNGTNPSSLDNGGGGGGGSFGGDGTQGMGSGGALPGETTGNDMLVPLDTPANAAGNRGNGGGGGGNGTLGLNQGGPGGGGGGVIEIWAGGDLIVDAAGAVRARGGPGGGNNGGGGGGSGGAILVRAGGAITAPSAWLTAPGGPGSNAVNDGGQGGVGRIRVDSTAAPVAGMGTDPAPVAGPAWAADNPTVVTTSSIALTARGPAGRSLALLVNDEIVGAVTIGAGGSGAANATLAQGLNTVCVAYTADEPALGTPEATSCITVAWVD